MRPSFYFSSLELAAIVMFATTLLCNLSYLIFTAFFDQVFTLIEKVLNIICLLFSLIGLAFYAAYSIILFQLPILTVSQAIVLPTLKKCFAAIYFTAFWVLTMQLLVRFKLLYQFPIKSWRGGAVVGFAFITTAIYCYGMYSVTFEEYDVNRLSQIGLLFFWTSFGHIITVFLIMRKAVGVAVARKRSNLMQNRLQRLFSLTNWAFIILTITDIICTSLYIFVANHIVTGSAALLVDQAYFSLVACFPPIHAMLVMFLLRRFHCSLRETYNSSIQLRSGPAVETVTNASIAVSRRRFSSGHSPSDLFSNPFLNDVPNFVAHQPKIVGEAKNRAHSQTNLDCERFEI